MQVVMNSCSYLHVRLLMDWSVGHIPNVGVPNERNHVGVVHPELERNEIEVEKLSSRPEQITTDKEGEIFLIGRTGER